MSLKRLLDMPDFKEKLTPLRPKLSRKIAAPLKVEPRSNRYGMVGTAFDYLLRFELHRRVPNAAAYPLIAEQAPDIIWKGTESNGSGDLVISWLDEVDPLYGRAASIIANRVRSIVERAKKAIAAYVKFRMPNRGTQAALAAHAIRLSRLDPVIYKAPLDQRFEEEPDSQDIEDLLSLLAIVPFESLLHDKVLLLNPILSCEWGVYRADLITSDMLVDFKTTMKSEMKPDDLDQLFGYFLLARHQRQTDPTFPEIKRLALYFSRHGYLWSVDAATWIKHPQFAEVEKWFFERAKEMFGHHPNLP